MIFRVHKNTDRMSKAACARLILYCEQGECFSFWESSELHDQKTKNWAEAQKTEKTDSADNHAFSILWCICMYILHIVGFYSLRQNSFWTHFLTDASKYRWMYLCSSPNTKRLSWGHILLQNIWNIAIGNWTKQRRVFSIGQLYFSCSCCEMRMHCKRIDAW